jgi:hypothetical protein
MQISRSPTISIAEYRQAAVRSVATQAGSSTLHAASAPATMKTSSLPHCDINTNTSSASTQTFKLSKTEGRVPSETNLQLKSQQEVRDSTSGHFHALRDTETSSAKAGLTVSSRTTQSTMAKLLTDPKYKALIDSATGGFRDPSTGLYCELVPLTQDTNSAISTVTGYVLCFPGVGSANMHSTQLLSSVKQFLGVGGVPTMHSQALELAKTIGDKLAAEGKTLELTGHSMGGGIANYVGLKLNLPAVCYNAAALGRACLKDIGETTLENLKKQTHIRLEGDFATHPSVTRKLMAFFTLGKNNYVPRNIGVINEIKTSDHYFPRDRFGLDRHALDSMRNWYSQ